MAVRAGDDRLLAFLLLNGAKPDVQNARGETPLHVAAGVQRLRYGPRAGDGALIEGARHHAMCGKALRAVHRAVAILVKNQAKIDIRDANGKVRSGERRTRRSANPS